MGKGAGISAAFMPFCAQLHTWFDRAAGTVVSDRRLNAGVQQYWKSAGSYSTVGLEFALSVIVGLFVGQWLDEKLGTGGWMTAVWLVFGTVAGARAVWRALQRANKEAELAEQKDREARREYFDERNEKPR